MLNNITPQDEQNYQNLLETLENINPTTFCNGIGKVKSAINFTQTRDKKAALKHIKKAFDMLDGLGFEVVLKPKKNGLGGL